MGHQYIDQINVEGGVPIRTPSSVQVEGQSSQGGIDGNFSYVRVIRTTATVKSSAGYLNRVVIGNTTPVTMRIYDSTTIVASSRQGTIINTVTKMQFTSAPQSISLDMKFTKGIRVVFSTPSDVTFSYR